MRQLSHIEARQALSVAADGKLDMRHQPALEQHLAECTECRAYAEQLRALEAQLSASLQARWPSQTPGNQDMAPTLEKIHTQARKKAMKNILSGSIRGLAWGALAILLLAVLTWSIRTLLPQPITNPAGETTPLASPDATLSPTEALLQPTEAPLNTPTLEVSTPTPATISAGKVSLFPQLEINFTAALPQAPDQLTLYINQLSEAVNIQSAREKAASLGVSGSVYNEPSEGGSDYIILNVNDGWNSVRFFSFPDQFIYTPFYRTMPAVNPGTLTFDQRLQAATQYLQAIGLLSVPYVAGKSETDLTQVRFAPLLDGYPVVFGIGVNPGLWGWINVTVNADGAVSQVDYSNHNFQAVGEYPILSAQQAWERFTSDTELKHSQYAVLAPEQPNTYRSWARNYPVNQPLELYGYSYSYEPADAESQPLVIFGSWPVSNPQAFTPQHPYDFLHVWGQLEESADGKQYLTVDRWEISSSTDDSISGTIQRQGDLGLLVSQDRTLLLPDLPADLPDGAEVWARGVTLPDNSGYPKLEWSFIETGSIPSSYGGSNSCGGGGGGGGGGPENADFGSGGFAMLNLNGEPTPTSIPIPYQGGDKISDVAGTINATLHQYSGGQSTLEVYFYPDASSGLSSDFGYKLEGAGINGLEQFNNLPVHIWATFNRLEDYYLVFDVERFEPLYPAAQIQEFAGTEAIINLEGTDVILLTTQDGQNYVLESSYNWPAQDQLIGRAGDLIGIEGFIIPDKLISGYAVIRQTSGEMPPDGIVSSAGPSIVDETQNQAFDLNAYMQGKLTIEQVELVYYSIVLDRCSITASSDPNIVSWLYVQPIWVFSGHFEDGRRFVVQVQALPDEYLK